MTARILIVDDVPASLRLLEVRLLAEYFEVVTATGGLRALEICAAGAIDLVLLDVVMPDIDGFETCRRLKADAATAHIPIVMVTSLDQVSDRIRGLEAGADDFLSKPVNDLQLITRVKSLVRMKMAGDELRQRASVARSLGIEDSLTRRAADLEMRPRILLVEDGLLASHIRAAAETAGDLTALADPQAAVFEAAEGEFDCIVVSGGLESYDPLRFCSQIRSLDRTRTVPIVLIAQDGEDDRIARALEIGVNDYVLRPVEENEFKARLATQLKRKRYNDGLRASVADTIEMAVIDALTGLHNRRFLDRQLETLVERAQSRRKPLSILIADVDRFKAINDKHGHDAGDAILKQFAQRLRKNVRGIDLACRYGGEEFVVVMPDTDSEIAGKVAERVRAEIAATSFDTSAGPVSATISIGVAALLRTGDSASGLMKRADVGLYEAKTRGRNQVVAQAA